MRRSHVIFALLALLLAATDNAHSQWRPDKNVEIVVPSAPGGSNDKTARMIERIMQEKRLVATTLTVVNKPGGGNLMAMNYVNLHPADGHYLMVGTPTILTNHIIGATALNYTDFTPLALLFTEHVVFAVRADSPFKDGRDLADRLKRDPKSVAIGFATALGSHNHIAVGLLAKAVGANVRALKVIAFKGSAEAMTALLGGHIDLVTTAAGNAAEQLAAGKVRVLGIAAKTRLPGPYAAVPTWKEQGIDVVFGGWRSIMGPKDLTPAQVAYWEGTLAQVVATPEWKTDLERNYLTGDFTLGAQFKRDLAAEYDAMKTILTELGLAKK